MRLIGLKTVLKLSLAVLLPALTVSGQGVRVELAKQINRIPKGCESVVPASVDGQIDMRALLNEALCKGAGDMLTEYSYTLTSNRRIKNKNGEVKETTTTFEVFIPTMKNGGRARGILVATSHDGVPVAPAELEKDRMKAGERLEKEEAKLEREPSLPPSAEETATKGMAPIGMYARTFVHHSSLTADRGAALAIQTFLQTCQFKFLKRAANEGREVLVFNFTARPDAQFREYEKYVAQLSGEIWIDAQDHIVSRLVGWPVAQQDNTGNSNPNERPPAVYVEMTRLKEGTWLPHMARINAADYPKLFDGITTDSTSTYANYIRFSTEIRDVKVNPPDNY